MLRSKLYRKLVLPVVLFACGLGALLLIAVTNRSREVLIDQETRRLQHAGRMMAAAYLRVPEASLHDETVQELVEQMTAVAGRPQLRIELIGTNGTVLADSADRNRVRPAVDTDAPNTASTSRAGQNAPPPNRNLPGPSFLNTRRELMQARTTGAGRNLIQDGSDGAMLSVAIRIGSGDDSRGYVVVSDSIDQALARGQSVADLVSGLILVVTLLSLPLLLREPVRLSAACETIRQASARMAENGVRETIFVDRNDEIGQLANSLNEATTVWSGLYDRESNRASRLEASSNRLETVLGAMIEGVISVDQHQEIVYSNPAVQRMLDLDDTCEGRLIWDTLRASAVHEVIREVLAGEQRRQLEFELPRKKITVLMLVTRLPGIPCPGIVLVLHDITELRRLESMRREFVSNVSHELKTPLTSIRAYTETLLEGAVDDPEHNRTFLERIESQSERLSLLIHDLLNLAKIESGREIFDLVPLRVADSVRNCMEARQAVAESKGVLLQVTPSPREAIVTADSEGLRTILDNLITNAINYTPAGGEVHVGWQVASGEVSLYVRDTGVGIPAEHHSRVFERFYRVDKARSREVGGTGLGLSIVKHLVGVFGGRIELSSAEGKGSVFTITLPSVPGDPAPEPAAISGSESRRPR